MTQEKLAAEAKVDIRTVQRAEAGEHLRHDTIADLAAVLGLPVSSLIDTTPDNDNSAAQDISVGLGLALKRTQSAREIIELLEGSHLAKLECDADPTAENINILTEVIELIEKMLPHPWSEGTGETLSFPSLVDRLKAIANMDRSLESLERAGLGLFTGSAWVNAIMPRWTEEGLATRTGQLPDNVRATRMLISPRANDKAVVNAATKWPVEIVAPAQHFNIPADLDEDVPF
jgi:transcriptional regulator with XRE-family HTH domain